MFFWENDSRKGFFHHNVNLIVLIYDLIIALARTKHMAIILLHRPHLWPLIGSMLDRV